VAEFVTLTQFVTGEQRLEPGDSFDIRFRPIQPGAVSVTGIGTGPRPADPEAEPEDSPVSVRLELFRPGDAAPVVTARPGRVTSRPLQYTVSEADFGLAGQWRVRVTNPNQFEARFEASIALPRQVELWRATLDLGFVNELISRALQLGRLQVHLQTHPTQARSWVTYSGGVARQFGLPPRSTFRFEPLAVELPVVHEDVALSLNDLDSRVVNVARFRGGPDGEPRLVVTIGFETEGRELTTSIPGLSHDIRSLSVTVEVGLDGRARGVVVSLHPASFDILGFPVLDVADKARDALRAQLSKADVIETIRRYLDSFLSTLVRLGPGARTHRVVVVGSQIVFEYYNESPSARRPLPRLKRVVRKSDQPFAIRNRLRLQPGQTHTIAVPLAIPGLVTVISRLKRRPPRAEIDPETRQPIPPPQEIPQQVRLLRRGRGGVSAVVAETDGDAITVVDRVATASEIADAEWTATVRNTGEFEVTADITVSHPTVKGNLGKVDHLVVLMMENRSFDHMLGHLAMDGRREVDGLRGTETNPFDGATFPVFPLETTVFCDDPGHNGSDVDEQIAGGMKGFVANFAAQPKREQESPGRVMGFHTAAQLPAYTVLAREFGVCHRWFSSVPGYTWPNRLYSITGTSAGERDGVPIDFDDPPVYDFRSIFEVLEGYGVPWTYYFNDLPFPVLLRRFVQDGAFSHKLRPFREFLDVAQRGELPAVSWIEPPFLNLDDDNPAADDHPPGDITAGQRFVASVYRALAASPLWQRTLLVIVYDEHGGFFDHVEPPTARNGDRLGVRVPALLVSPWIRRGHVSKVQYDHTALLRTILDRFCSIQGVPPPSLGSRVDTSRHLGDELLGASARQTAPRIPFIPAPATRPCDRPDDAAPDDLAKVMMWIAHGLRAP
jgi:phospholipase C